MAWQNDRPEQKTQNGENAMTSKEAAAMINEKCRIKKELLRGKNDEFSIRLSEIERALELFRIVN